MLHHPHRRDPLTRRAVLLSLACALMVSLPVAAGRVTPRAEAPVPPAAAADATRVEPPARDVNGTAATAGGAAQTPPPPPVPRQVPMALSDVVQDPPATPPPAPPQAPVATPPVALSGVAYDATEGVLPGVSIALTDMSFVERYATVTDSSGRFRFRTVPPGRYYVVASLPGFATVTQVAAVAAGREVEQRMTLPLAGVEETITVSCPAAAAGATSFLQHVAFVPGADAVMPGPQLTRDVATRVRRPVTLLAAQGTSLPAPVRVGGNAVAPRRATTVVPACPDGAVPAGETLVTLAGRIGADGEMHDLRAQPFGAPPAALVESALEAVGQWTFTPARLNAGPADISIRVQVVFRRR